MVRVQFAVDPEQEELLSALLWLAGCVGVTSQGDGVLVSSLSPPAGSAIVEAFFDHTPDLSGLVEAGFAPATVNEEPPADWLALWRASAQPIAIGDNLLIEPGEPDSPTPITADLFVNGRRRILVPARAAFGTGSHETTRLMLDALSDHPPRHQRILDVGCGSGILSFVALALGASWAAGFEVDLESACLAGVNARLNVLSPQFWAGTLDALGPGVQFDLILVNVLPERILDRAPDLASHLAPQGRLLYGGHLLEQEGATIARWEAAGLRPSLKRALGDWGLLELVHQ